MRVRGGGVFFRFYGGCVCGGGWGDAGVGSLLIFMPVLRFGARVIGRVCFVEAFLPCCLGGFAGKKYRFFYKKSLHA